MLLLVRISTGSDTHAELIRQHTINTDSQDVCTPGGGWDGACCGCWPVGVSSSTPTQDSNAALHLAPSMRASAAPGRTSALRAVVMALMMSAATAGMPPLSMDLMQAGLAAHTDARSPASAATDNASSSFGAVECERHALSAAHGAQRQGVSYVHHRTERKMLRGGETREREGGREGGTD